MAKRIFWYVVAMGLIVGCVPNKRITYLQNDSDPKAGEFQNTDTMKRRYTTRFAEYQLKAGDIISLNIASITPQEFDFVKKYEEQLGIIRKLNQYDQSNKGSGNSRNNSGGGGGGSGSGSVNGTGDGGISPIALDRLQSGFIIDEEGFLELPYVGKVELKGKTIPQAEALIREKVRGYFETPVIRIQLLSFHFTILGEVNTEGRYTIFDQNASIVDAIALASNLTDFADRSQIKVVRRTGINAEVFYVNMLREDILGQPGFYLQPDDFIIVPPLKARASRKYTVPTYVMGV
ncbi:MAG TPA: polysaccharide biosynthesis/export family protein, partial [Chryseolinea sp.]|nr:polysaccharide biosynthesis/export family protein [Chryseolinea sp.]